MVERGKMQNRYPNTKLYVHPLLWPGTDTSIKCCGLQLDLIVQTSPLGEIIRSGNCFQHLSKMQTITYNRANSNVETIDSPSVARGLQTFSTQES